MSADLRRPHPHPHRPLPGPGPVNPLSSYLVFQGTVVSGPDAGMVIKGPLVLAEDGRIQVVGNVFPANARPITVVGTVYGGGANLRFVLPTRSSANAVEVTGNGVLVQVPRALNGGLALAGHGIMRGPANNDVGQWVTVRP
jgi:hypothetical protein